MTSISTTPRQHAWPEGHWDWYQHLAFKHGIRVGSMVFIGGQVDKTSAGEPRHVDDLNTQTQVVMNHIARVLAEYGADVRSITKLVAFFMQDGNVDEAILKAAIGDHLLGLGMMPDDVGPVLTLVPLRWLALPGMRIEIEAIAMLDGESKPLPRTRAETRELAPLPRPFSHGLRSEEHIWVGEQPTFDALFHVLSSLGACPSHVVKTHTWFAADEESRNWQQGALDRARHFEIHGPAVVELPSPCLPVGQRTRSDVWAMSDLDGSMLPKTFLNAPRWQWPMASPSNLAVSCKEFVFLSAQWPLDLSGQLCFSGELNEQTRLAMGYTQAALESFGLTLDHMVKQNSFFLGKADPNDIVTNQRLRSSYYTEPAGVSTGVPLTSFPIQDLMVSVDTVAMR